MTSVNYDRAISYYDATRGFRAGVSERFRKAALELTGATERTRFLELAIGTGVIGLPFAAASFEVVKAIRVFHMLVDWRACIDEARRHDLYPSEAMLLRYLRLINADTQVSDLLAYVESAVSCRTMVERRAAHVPQRLGAARADPPPSHAYAL